MKRVSDALAVLALVLLVLAIVTSTALLYVLAAASLVGAVATTRAHRRATRRSV